MFKVVLAEPGKTHAESVADIVDKLQAEGFNVKNIQRVSCRIFWMGEDVTYIIYEQ